MGAGKSSVGRAIADQLGWTFEDLDERIERREGQRVADIFRNVGEAEFRRAEHEALKEALDELLKGAEKILALGGGAFVYDSNASLIEASRIPTVFMDAEVEELWERCTKQSVQQGPERPLLGNFESFRDLYEQRHHHYSRASLTKNTSGKAIKTIAAELIQVLGLERRRKGRGEKQ